MIKNSSKETGSAHVVIIVILIVAIIGALGFVVWKNFLDTPDSSNTSKSVVTPKNEETSKEDTLTYRSEAIGIEFKYPKDWIKVECDNTYVEDPQNRVYFGTTNEGLAIVDGESTQLCGGGSDFPPQMRFSIGNAPSAESIEYYNENAESITEITIDGKVARKIVYIAGSDTIAPYSESETTSYSINIGNGRAVAASYIRWPSQTSDLSGGRDNSEASKDKFIDVVEKSLRFL